MTEESSIGSATGARSLHAGLQVLPPPQSSLEAGHSSVIAARSSSRREAFREAKPMACRQSCSCAPCFLNKIHSKSGKKQTLPCIGALANSSECIDVTTSSSTSAMAGEDAECQPQQNPDVAKGAGQREGWRDLGQNLGALCVQDVVSRDRDKEASFLLQGSLRTCEGFQTHHPVQAAVPDVTNDGEDAMAAVGGNATSRHAVPSESSGKPSRARPHIAHDGAFIDALHKLDRHIRNLRQWNRKYLNGNKDGWSNGVEPALQLDECASMCNELVSLLRGGCEANPDSMTRNTAG
jgi:hypothetical protein